MLAFIPTILTLIVLEWILSVDNAIALATMVKHLPKETQKKALRYWIIWAYVFRWIFLLFAFIIMKILWLKLVWWLYLIYLFYWHFFKKHKSLEEDVEEKIEIVEGDVEKIEKEIEKDVNLLEHNKPKSKNIISWIYNFFKQKWFWATVITVEFMDIVFSLDNVLAAAALSSNIYVVMIWVMIWITTMRFVAWKFIDILEKYPKLENSAYLVMWVLWVKLVLSFMFWTFHMTWAEEFLESHTFSLVNAIVTLGIFAYPFLSKNK